MFTKTQQIAAYIRVLYIINIAFNLIGTNSLIRDISSRFLSTTNVMLTFIPLLISLLVAILLEISVRNILTNKINWYNVIITVLLCYDLVGLWSFINPNTIFKILIYSQVISNNRFVFPLILGAMFIFTILLILVKPNQIPASSNMTKTEASLSNYSYSLYRFLGMFRNTGGTIQVLPGVYERTIRYPILFFRISYYLILAFILLLLALAFAFAAALGGTGQSISFEMILLIIIVLYVPFIELIVYGIKKRVHFAIQFFKVMNVLFLLFIFGYLIDVLQFNPGPLTMVYFLPLILGISYFVYIAMKITVILEFEIDTYLDSNVTYPEELPRGSSNLLSHPQNPLDLTKSGIQIGKDKTNQIQTRNFCENCGMKLNSFSCSVCGYKHSKI